MDCLFCFLCSFFWLAVLRFHPSKNYKSALLRLSNIQEWWFPRTLKPLKLAQKFWKWAEMPLMRPLRSAMP